MSPAEQLRYAQALTLRQIERMLDKEMSQLREPSSDEREIDAMLLLACQTSLVCAAKLFDRTEEAANG